MSKALAKFDFSYKKTGQGYSIETEIDLDRFEPRFQKAQYNLDSQIMTDMVKYMPMDTGTFINVTRAMSAALAGSGAVVAAAPPFGRFLYEGKTMVDEVTGSPWARKGAKKVLVSQFGGKTRAKPNLVYLKAANPDATSHWFDPAKEENLDKWIGIAQKDIGGD